MKGFGHRGFGGWVVGLKVLGSAGSRLVPTQLKFSTGSLCVPWSQFYGGL